MASMTIEEYWHEQRRLARIEEKLDRALEENHQLEAGLAETGQIVMDLREQMRQLEEAIAAGTFARKEKVVTN